MTALQSQWYNTVVTALDLDPQTFQLTQSTVPVPNTSRAVWEFFNSAPPLSLTNSFAQGSLSNLYDNWRGVLGVLIPQADGAAFDEAMGDRMRDWVAYKGHKFADPMNPPSAEELYAAFKMWADFNLSPTTAARVEALYRDAQFDSIKEAQDAVRDPDNLLNGYPKFTATIDDLRGAIASGRSVPFSFDSARASDDVSSAWAQAQNGRPFFSNGQGSFVDLSTRAQQSRITVDGRFEKVISFGARPSGWLRSDALAIAFNTKDSRVWKFGPTPTWDSTFGPHGNMLRYAGEIVAYDGLDVTITSHAAYSAAEQDEVRVAADRGGVWPFFGQKPAKVTFDASGSLVVTAGSQQGNPAILGVNVNRISRLFE